jgi:prepilin-type N-terminal cleavage/methylation domain-containing protein
MFDRRRKGFTLLELIIVMTIVGVMTLSIAGEPPAFRGYPWSQIGMLFLVVGFLAELARQALDCGRRDTCAYLLAAGCVLCVASMASTVAKHCEREKPIPSVRLSDPATFHMSCPASCRERGK